MTAKVEPHFRWWHFSDMPTALRDVRFQAVERETYAQ